MMGPIQSRAPILRITQDFLFGFVASNKYTPHRFPRACFFVKCPTDRCYRTAYDFLQKPPEYKELEKAVNDPEHAKLAQVRHGDTDFRFFQDRSVGK